MPIHENDVLVFLPRSLRPVRKRLLWRVPGPPVTSGKDSRGQVWALQDGSITIYPEYAVISRSSGSIFADYMVLPGHRVKDRRVDLSIRQSWCCKAHLTGPYTDICTTHKLDAEALRLAGA